MSRNKTKICLGCQRIFDARRDAKTCSARCRKRYQRAKSIYYATKPLEWQRSSMSFKQDMPAAEVKRYAG